jgi:hypothetical protein
MVPPVMSAVTKPAPAWLSPSDFTRKVGSHVSNAK